MTTPITLYGQEALDWIKEMAPEDYPHVIRDMRKRKLKIEDYKVVAMQVNTADEETDAIVKLMNDHKGNRKVEYMPSIKHKIN